MKINKDRQREAREKAQQLLALEEQKRAEMRLLKLIAAIEQGNGEVLYSNEFLDNLPELIATYCQSEDYQQVKGLLENIGEFARNDDPNLRERAAMALSLSLSCLERGEHPDIRSLIINLLLRWLEVETNYFSVCAIVCRQLQENAIEKLEEGVWRECDITLELFRKIQEGQLEKNNAIRSVVGRTLDAIAADHILEELSLVCLRGRGERRDNAEKTLVLLGRKAAIHLLDRLIVSQEKEDRLRLIDIIPTTGYAASPVLKAYLQEDLPWYGFRNIILMISKMKEQDLLPLTLPFLEHEDIRVQQQVVDCIHTLEKEKPGAYLLTALTQVNDELKAPLIEYLGQTREPGAMDVFLDLLARRDTFPPHTADDLLRCLAIQVRLSDSVRALNLLTMLVKERGQGADSENDPVAQAAARTLQLLEFRFATAEQSPGQPEKTGTGAEGFEKNSKKGAADESPTFDGDPLTKNPARRNVQKINEEVAKLLGEDKAGEASQLLYEKCIEAAMSKDFDSAEMLRDRILEVDPSALPQLIRAGERVEEERSSTIPHSHVTVWQELYDSLSTEEFNALYHALEAKTYSNGSLVVKQGTADPALYFINSGQARLTCGDSEEEIFLKKIKPGEIVGVGPFFDVSVWTASLTATAKTDVHVLQRDTFLDLARQFPTIETCLRSFCLKNDAVCELLEMSGKDRRRAARHPVSLVVKHTLLDTFGDEGTRSFNGEVTDISSGGCSLSLLVHSGENARLFLGRYIQTQFTVKGEKPVLCKGQIVAVRLQKFETNRHTVHVQFIEPISDDVVKSIANIQ